MAGKGDKNVLILTYTNTLTDFIQSGIGSKGLIAANQIRTYHSWANEHVLHQLGIRAIPNGIDFDENIRAQLFEKVIEANARVPSEKLTVLFSWTRHRTLPLVSWKRCFPLSDRVCICGDSRQGIYNRDGLNVAGTLSLQQHVLTRHFRIGQKIARVADRLLPPAGGTPSLEDTSNYNPKTQGESSAKMLQCASRDEQFNQMVDFIRVQLDAFNDDTIGIFCGTRETLAELRERFNQTDLAEYVFVHGIDENATFNGERRIHALTIHGAKGTEFRAVHLYATEDLANFPLNRSRLAYTAITRAKTSLLAYRTGPTNVRLENAFSELHPL